MVRASHIPVEVRSAASKKAVREAAESALLHGPGMGSPEARAAFERMSEPHRIAVCLTAMQGFAELLAGIAAKGGEGPNEYTDKFFGLLDSVSIDHAALAIRNCGQREGGVFTYQIITDFQITRSSVAMRVYLAISAHWRGADDGKIVDGFSNVQAEQYDDAVYVWFPDVPYVDCLHEY